MTLSFPPSPTPGQVYVGPNGVTYVWDDVAKVWNSNGTGSAFSAGLGLSYANSVAKVSLPEQTSPPVAGSGASQAVVGSIYWNTGTGTPYIYYDNGGNPVWVQAIPRGGSVTPAPSSLSFPTSPTNGQQYAAPNGITYTWSSGLNSWGASGTQGTVTNVTGTLPIVVANGTSTPAVSIDISQLSVLP